MKPYDRALIIDEPWISKILSGEKTLEMRSRHTNIRGRIGLIKKGSGLIVGDAWLKDSIDISNCREAFENYHCIDYNNNPELFKYSVAWVLTKVHKYSEPIPYKHPSGAVVWVKI